MRELQQIRDAQSLPRVYIAPDTSTYLFLNEAGDMLESLDLKVTTPQAVIEALIDRLKVLQEGTNSRFRDLAIGGLVCALSALEEGTDPSSTAVSE